MGDRKFVVSFYCKTQGFIVIDAINWNLCSDPTCKPCVEFNNSIETAANSLSSEDIEKVIKSLQNDQWNFYLKKCNELQINNVMSFEQFKQAVKSNELPFNLELRNSGYRYGDLT